DIRTECVKELADDVPCLCAHARYLIVLVKMLPQKLFELLLLLRDFPAESDQRRNSPDFVQGPRACLLDIHCALPDQISRQRIDHAPHCFMDQPPARDFWVLLSGHCQMACKYTDLLKLLLRNETGSQAVVHIVIVVSDLISEIGDLRFQRRPMIREEALANVPQFQRIFLRTMLENAF